LILPPERVPLNGSVLGTVKGTWIIRVDEAMRLKGTTTLVLNVTLERSRRSPEEACVRRRLGLLLSSSVMDEFRLREGVACDIRGWLESTDGDGFLDLRAIYIQAV